jgi:hypothetical protein
MESNVAGHNPASASRTFRMGGVAAVNGSSNNWTALASVPQPLSTRTTGADELVAVPITRI